MKWVRLLAEWEFSYESGLALCFCLRGKRITGLSPGESNVNDTARLIMTGILSAPPEVLAKFRGRT